MTIIYSVCPIFTNPVDRLKTLSNGEAGKKLGGDKNEKGGNGFPHSLSLILINDIIIYSVCTISLPS